MVMGEGEGRGERRGWEGWGGGGVVRGGELCDGGGGGGGLVKQLSPYMFVILLTSYMNIQ